MSEPRVSKGFGQWAEKHATKVQDRTATSPGAFAEPASGALNPLLALAARESSPRPTAPLHREHALANLSRPASLQPRSPVNPTSRRLKELFTASPEARSPRTPRSPYSTKRSLMPSSPGLAAAAQLQPALPQDMSSGSLERMLCNGPYLAHSLSCSSFPHGVMSQLPSASPEPFAPAAPIQSPSVEAFRQERLPSSLSATAHLTRQAPRLWIPAVPTYQVPRAAAFHPAPGTDDCSKGAAVAPRSTRPAIKRARPESTAATESETAGPDSATVSADEWVPRRSRRSSRTMAHKSAATKEPRSARRATRAGWQGGTAAVLPGERRAVPPAIRRLLAPHGNRGVTPFRSVSLMVRTGRYDVTPHHFKRQVYLGSYETAEQAGRVADLAEVAAGKPGMRLNFEGEYGAEAERAAEVATQPGMTPDKLKAWVIHTLEHIKSINRKGRSAVAAEELECVPSSLQTHISQMVHQDSISLGYYTSKDRAASVYDQVVVQALGLKAQTNFSISNYKHLLSEADRNEVQQAEQQVQTRDGSRG
eukprot:jgi/Ulvmu1/658/UM010_0029.1